MTIPHDASGFLTPDPSLDFNDAPADATPTTGVEPAERTDVVSAAAPAAPAAKEADDEADAVGPPEVFRLAALPPSETVEQGYDIFIPMDGPFVEDATTLHLPAETSARTSEALEALPNLRLDDSPAGRAWLDSLEQSALSRPLKQHNAGAVEREASTWRQIVQGERGPLAIGVPKFKDIPGGEKATGERAVWRVRSALGMGSVIMIPLWHSGFWITIKAPSEGEMLELHRRISEEKISLGRQTYGLAFSNTSVIYANAVLQLALSNVYETSLKDVDANDGIRSKISALDIPLIAWGLACVNWPRGFQYARALLDFEGGTPKLEREKIAIGKLLWTDTSALTPWQIKHMSQRGSSSMAWSAVERYRSEFTRGQGREVEIGGGVKLTLRVPSMSQYIASGQKWVNTIVQMVDRAFGLEQDLTVRNQYIYAQGNATVLRQYAHWVESIDSSGMVVEDADTIDSILDSISGSDEVRKTFFEAQRKFAEDATIALVAVPSANADATKTLPRFPHLLPLDVMSTFFILLEQKTTQIRARD